MATNLLWICLESYCGLNAKANSGYEELGLGAAVVLDHINVLVS
jgi:hypothetical protein